MWIADKGLIEQETDGHVKLEWVHPQQVWIPKSKLQVMPNGDLLLTDAIAQKISKGWGGSPAYYFKEVEV